MYGERKIVVDKNILPEEKRKAKIESINVTNVSQELISRNITAEMDSLMEFPSYIEADMSFPNISESILPRRANNIDNSIDFLSENLQGNFIFFG
jgi:hypothetical protein